MLGSARLHGLAQLDARNSHVAEGFQSVGLFDPGRWLGPAGQGGGVDWARSSDAHEVDHQPVQKLRVGIPKVDVARSPPLVWEGVGEMNLGEGGQVAQRVNAIEEKVRNMENSYSKTYVIIDTLGKDSERPRKVISDFRITGRRCLSVM